MSGKRPLVRRWRRTATALAAFVIGMLLAPGVAVAAPVGPAQLNAPDMMLLQGVRLAGLWEIPAGQMAAEKGKRERVRQIGAEIAKQHVELDKLVTEAANKLGAVIPTDPTAEQAGWLKEMQDESGDQFDRIFVMRLRAAHGKILPVVTAVRAATRDPIIRKLADQTNTFVTNHMLMLESTGLVRFTDLPPAALPAPAPDNGLSLARANTGPEVGPNQTIVWVVLVAALGIAGFIAFRIVRGRT
jgi:predicted outer membrane protein